MTRPAVRARLYTLTAVVAMILAYAGCGKAPLAPVEDVAKGPPVLIVEPNGTVSFKQPEPLMPDGHDLEAGSRSLQVSKAIDGEQGGWMKCGRMYLLVPRGAFDSLGTITMSMKDSTAMLVDLEITPASLNDFKVPVFLVANTSDVDVDCDSLSLYWYDQDHRDWVAMSTERSMSSANECRDDDDDNASKGLWTWLTHFSTYSAGKAGW